MQVVVNQRFIQKRANYSRIGTFAGLGALTAGFIVTFFPEYQMASWIGMIVGITAFNYGRYNAVRWVNRPRDDEIVALNLKGLDHRHRLLNYMPQVSGVNHFLLSPHGVYTFEVRRDEGKITNNGSRWSRRPSIGILLRTMFEGGLGNPTQDAQRQANALRRYFVQSLGEEEAMRLPIQPLIVFADSRAHLDLIAPTVPVLTPRDIRSYMRKAQRDARVSDALLAKLNEAFGL